MDILQLIDRLEELFNESKAIPLTRNVMVDEDRMLDLIDQMRVAIPDEVKKAKRTIQERDRIMAQANEEAARIVELAKEDATQLSAEHEISKSAQGRAAQLIERAQRESAQLRADADEYSLKVLSDLEAELVKQLTVARNGLLKLETERASREIRSGGGEQSGSEPVASAAATSRS